MDEEKREKKKLKERLKKLGIKKTRGPERGFAPDFPNPGPVTPRKDKPRQE